jgi:hypothetical protein
VGTSPLICPDLREENSWHHALGYKLHGLPCRFPLDCFSYVRLLPPFQVISLFPTKALIEASSAAIWNKKKLIVGIGTAVWLTNVGVTIWGKSLSPFLLPVQNLIKTRIASGITRVSN